jgi:predicted DNA-binding protein YlxM (UPF0122 family)
MKTIAEIAKEIGVSRQAVYKKTKQAPLSTSLQKFASTVDNKIYISVDGEKLIKSAFDKKDLSTELTEKVDKFGNQLTASLQEEIRFLRGQNEDLRKENSKLTEKVLEQSERLLTLTEQAQKLAENAQTLHAMENIKPQLTEGKKTNFFKRFFSKRE